MRVDHTRMKEDYDDLFSVLGRVNNFTYEIDVDEKAVSTFDERGCEERIKENGRRMENGSVQTQAQISSAKYDGRICSKTDKV
jgi:hypothetical protein